LYEAAVDTIALAWGISPVARLTDPERLKCYQNALSNWRYTGYVQLTEFAEQAFKRLGLGIEVRELQRLLAEFVQADGEIDEVVETRPEWSDWDYHFDLRPIISGRKVYVETRLHYRDPNDADDPVIFVVNIHDA
jgi:hypothetical protein